MTTNSATDRTNIVYKLQQSGTVRIDIVPDTSLSESQKKKEKSWIDRAKSAVSSAFKKLRKRKLSMLSTLVVAVILHQAHTRGYLPTKAKLERDLLAVLRGTIKDNEAAHVLKKAYAENKQLFDKYRSKISDNFCKYVPGHCNPGFMERKHMPQANLDRNLKVGATNGRYQIRSATLTAGSLIPTQKEFLTTKVLGMYKSFSENTKAISRGEIVVAQVGDDFFVLDGHHRWYGALLANKNSQIRARVISADGIKSVASILGYVMARPHTTFQTLHGKQA